MLVLEDDKAAIISMFKGLKESIAKELRKV